jgi:hypothetical protein
MSQKMDLQFLDTVLPAFRRGDMNVDRKLEEAANIGLMQEVYKAIANHNFDALGPLLAEDAVLEIVGPAGSPMSGVFRGREQVVEAARRNFGMVEEQKPEILSIVAQGDSVIVVGKETGRYRPTGREYEMHWMHEYTFREGKLARVRELLDRAELIRAAQQD